MQNQDGRRQLQIQQLKKQLFKFKEQAVYWQQKYKNIQKEHNQLLQYLKTNTIYNTQQKKTINHKQQTQMQTGSINLLDDIQQETYVDKRDFYQFSKASDFALINIKKTKQISIQVKTHHLSLEDDQCSSPSKQSPTQQSEQDVKQIDFFSVEQIQKQASWVDTKEQHQQDSQLYNKSYGLQLIQGYFIIQKIDGFKQNSKNYKAWVKDCNLSLLQRQKNLLEIIYRYTFREEPLQAIKDDPFDSRLNEIKYGTPYENLIYYFDNFQVQPQNTECVNQKFMKMSMRKKFVYCLIRPQIARIQGKIFQTEIMYGFISPFPFRHFFQALHRTLQQQIKYEILNSKKQINEQVQISKQIRIQIVSCLMKKVYQECLTNYSHINSYPLNIVIQTKVTQLKIQIQSQQEFNILQKQYLQQLLKKYNLVKISKLLHYVLAEKQIVIVSTSRKNLNQILQIVRLAIRPFHWVFPIVFRYSDHFQPFFSSPMPLIIGIVFDFNNKNSKQNQVLISNQLITIFVEENLVLKDTFLDFFSSNKPKYTPSDLREIASYEKDIVMLTKYLQKIDKKSISSPAERIQKYVNSLKLFIQSGEAKRQISGFLIDFIETQMVQYYKDVIIGSNSKITPNQDYNEDLAMTR